jgi:hypothetical protein
MAGRTQISPDQERFLEWLLTPHDMRQPSSQNEWARQNNLATQTVARWKTQDVLFRSTWEKRLYEMGVGPERLQVLLEKLYQAGAEGDIPALKLYMSWVERISPPKKTETEEARIEDMTDEEFADFAQGLAELRAQHGTEATTY